jgi:precorrin-3B synthase
VTPFPDPAGETAALVASIEAVAGDMPVLPDKMGVLVDAGESRWLAETSGDFRFERAEGGVILRADGVGRGRSVTVETAGDALLELAEWFVATGGAESRRMKHHVATHNVPGSWCDVAPEASSVPPGPDLSRGHLGVAFGQMMSDDLRKLIVISAASVVTFTTWRSLVLTDILDGNSNISVTANDRSLSDADISVGKRIERLAGFVALEGSPFIADASDARLNVVACPGAPACAQASIETRALAARLAPHARSLLHVSGCAKGCARQKAAPFVLVGRDGAFDLVQDGKAQDDPIRTAISEDEVIAYLRSQAAGAAGSALVQIEDDMQSNARSRA